MNPQSFYQSQQEKYLEKVNSTQKSKNKIAWLRLIVFIAFAVLTYFAFAQSLILLYFSIALLALFLFLVSKFTDLSKRKEFYERIVKMNIDELKGLENDFSSFNNGKEFENSQHPYSLDLDLFAKNGLFAYLNRTVSPNGKSMLANFLLNGHAEPERIYAAIQDLKENADWRQKYLSGAEITNESIEIAVTTWLNTTEKLSSFIRIAKFITPFIAFVSMGLWTIDILSNMSFLLMIFLTLLPTGINAAKANLIMGNSSKSNEKWNSMLNSVEEIEKHTFSSDYLKELQARLVFEGSSSKKSLKRIIQLNNLADYRMNMLMGIVLNFLLAWDSWILTFLLQWLDDNKLKFNNWEKDLSEFEALLSGANYAFNREDLSQAKLGTNNIECIDLGHPLISNKISVKNSFLASETMTFSIITGPNMAGKSTFLRAVGVNLILARCGFPVVAKQFHFPNLKLYSSMRTTDDLNSSSSYFFAELTRLRFIMDAVNKGEKVFIILDEILKGTNSIDKEQGSKAFLEKLKKLNVKGIIATHDLSLCELSSDSDYFQNLYFDSIIEKDELSFDYTIRNGVCKNMNASFLLKKMGLTD